MRKLVLCAAAVLLTLPAQGAISVTPTLTGPDVIWYTNADQLGNPVRYVLQGKRLPDGGCNFDVSLRLPPDAKRNLQVQEIAYDPATCRSLMERGEYGDLLPPRMAGAAITKVWHAWYQDPEPLAIHVNDVWNGITWSPSSTCATPSGTSFVPTRRYDHYEQTGWTQTGANWTTGVGCPSAYSSSYATFRNGIFCAFITTYTTYNRNTIYGYPNGGYFGTTNASKSGGCNGLLSFKSRYE